jgi:ATP-dependent helicase YprA (DUF1998 family)
VCGQVETHRVKIVLELGGIRAGELHGNLNQAQRLEALEQFKEGAVDVLVCTDLAARGLDISGIETVINAEMPRSRYDRGVSFGGGVPECRVVMTVGRLRRGANALFASSFRGGCSDVSASMQVYVRAPRGPHGARGLWGPGGDAGVGAHAPSDEADRGRRGGPEHGQEPRHPPG